MYTNGITPVSEQQIAEMYARYGEASSCIPPQSLGTIWAHAADACIGEERSSPSGDRCCSWKTWNNGTYLAVKGEKALQFYNEIRVQSACIQLDQRSDPAYPRLEEIAYDLTGMGSPIVVDPDFLERFPRASANFYALFPPQRWHSVKNAIPTSCQSDGAYNVWRDDGPDPVSSEVRSRAEAAVVKFGQTFTQWLGSPLASAPPGQRGAYWTIRTVPGGGPDQLVQTLPNNDVQERLPNDLFQIITTAGGGRVLMPSPWVQSFMDTFAPKKSMTMVTNIQTLSLPSQAPPPLRLTKYPAITQLEPVTQEDLASALPPDESGGFQVKPWMMVAGGVLVLGLVGGGVYFAMK